MFRFINNRGTALLAVMAFVVLTAIIAEAFLIYFYNQSRLTMQKTIYEKAFYYALGAIASGKVLVKRTDQLGTGELAVNGSRTIKSWGGTPNFDLRYLARFSNEYPEAPITYFKIEIQRPANDKLISYAYCEIKFGSEIVSAVRRIEVTIDVASPDLTEKSWQEISPALTPVEEASIYN